MKAPPNFLAIPIQIEDLQLLSSCIDALRSITSKWGQIFPRTALLDMNPFDYRPAADDLFDANAKFWSQCTTSEQQSGLLFMRAYGRRIGPIFEMLISLKKHLVAPWGEVCIGGSTR